MSQETHNIPLISFLQHLWTKHIYFKLFQF